MPAPLLMDHRVDRITIYKFCKIGLCLQLSTKDRSFQLPAEHGKYGFGRSLIKVHVECTVKGGRSEIDKIIVILVQEAIYVCNMGIKEEARKKERLIFSEAQDPEDAEPGECQVERAIKEFWGFKATSFFVEISTQLKLK